MNKKNDLTHRYLMLKFLISGYHKDFILKFQCMDIKKIYST